jgi:pimeloyl-ACP methyl ester carboxylesterase
MAVSNDLLGAAEKNDHDAIDMVSIWGLGFPAEIGGSLAPGVWMHGGAQRTLEAAKPGVLHADLAACNAYRNATTAARSANIPVTLILGERDMMTSVKNGRALAAAFPNARTVVLKGAGHMLMAERPDDVLAACRGAA